MCHPLNESLSLSSTSLHNSSTFKTKEHKEWVNEELNFFHQFQIQKIETSVEEFYSPLVDLGMLCRKSFMKLKKKLKKSWDFLINFLSSSEAVTRHCSVTLIR